MRFAEPSYLLLLIPIGLALAWSWKQVHGMAKGRKRLAFVIRAIMATLLVFALAGPEARRPNEGLCTIFLVDRSDSISDSDRALSEKFIQEAARNAKVGDMVGVIAFGKDAIIDSSPSGRRELGAIQSKIDGSATDIAAAVRLASASFPEGKGRRVVLLSDGDETAGDLAEAAQVSASDGIQIDHVTLGLGTRRAEAAVVALDAPEQARIEQPINLRALIDTTVAQNALLNIDRDGVLIKQLRLNLTQGRNAVVFSDSLKAPGFHKYRVTLDAQIDSDNRNNIGLAFVSVRGKPRILVLQEHPEKSPLTGALKKNGIDAEVTGPAGVPSSPEDLQNFDAIAFNDINADSITVSQMKMIQAAVRDSGIGFAMIGGENSFLPGGYYNTPIAELLPVDLNIRQRKTFPSTSVCIICDTSGSMGMLEDGVPKVQLAAKAAADTVRMMSPNDRVAVAGSTDGIEYVVPMQSAASKDAIVSQCMRLSVGGGGIYCQPSMLSGEQTLMKENSEVRHFLLLSDGDDAEDQDNCFAIAARMRANKITTSVVAIGDGKDVEFLRKLALVGGGRFYLAKHANQLPAVMTQDTSLMSRSAIEEGAFLPKMSPDEPILADIDGVPPLLAYCLTDTRPLSRVGMRTNKDDPLLATWQYGLGTSLAFTSDAQARWAQRWVGWPGFGAFWSQAVRQISRRATQNQYQVTVHQEGGKGQVEVKAFDRLGNPMTTSNAKVRVTLPTGEMQEINVTQQAPGDYTGSFESTELGSYIVSVSEPDQSGGQRVSTSGFSVPYPPEYRTYRPNTPLMIRTSEITGGREITQPQQAMRTILDPGVSITELWATFVIAAGILLPFDIAIRRIALPVGEIMSKVLAHLKSSRKTAPLPQQEVVGRLQQAKQRAQKDVATPTGPPPAPRQTPPPPPDRAAASAPSSASQSLLEAKRKRRE